MKQTILIHFETNLNHTMSMKVVATSWDNAVRQIRRQFPSAFDFHQSKIKAMSENKQSVEEGNTLINDFMGEEHDECFEIFGPDPYHSSWNALMPVVEKIESVIIDNYEDTTSGKKMVKRSPSVEIVGGYCEISVGGYLDSMDKLCYCAFQTIKKSKSKIEAVWQAVIEFIQWYNNQNKQS